MVHGVNNLYIASSFTINSQLVEVDITQNQNKGTIHHYISSSLYVCKDTIVKYEWLKSIQWPLRIF